MHLDILLPTGLSNKPAYRLNVTLMASETGAALTQKIFCLDKPYILSLKGFKVTPLFGATLNPNQHALNLHLPASKA